MKVCGISIGVLFTSVLACCVAAENFNLLRIKRQTTGGDPNLEAIFGQQNGNSNFGNGQSSSSGNERPPFGFEFPELNEGLSNNNGAGAFGGINNNAANAGSNNNQNQGFNQWPSGSGSGSGSGYNGAFSANTQGSPFGGGGGQTAQSIQRPQTTQRTPLNVISTQNTIDNTECARRCRTRATQQYSPVCGSDNISYVNRQTFDCYQRECRSDVSIVYAGSCITTRVPSTSTPNYFS